VSIRFEFDPVTEKLTLIEDHVIVGGGTVACTLGFIYDLLTLQPGTIVEALGPDELGRPKFRFSPPVVFIAEERLPKEVK
jgi:hypothetical protein